MPKGMGFMSLPWEMGVRKEEGETCPPKKNKIKEQGFWFILLRKGTLNPEGSFRSLKPRRALDTGKKCCTVRVVEH